MRRNYYLEQSNLYCRVQSSAFECTITSCKVVCEALSLIKLLWPLVSGIVSISKEGKKIILNNFHFDILALELVVEILENI